MSDQTRILGLDIGDRRIGVALSDTLGIMATPLTIVERTDEQREVALLVDIIQKNEVSDIVVGLPLAPDGGIGKQAASIKDFADALARQIHVPIVFRDESLTTSEARRIMLTSRSKKNRRKSHDDDVAAAVLLQAYLEEIRGEIL